MKWVLLSVLLGVCIIIATFIITPAGPAYAHYFGSSLKIDNYMIVFSPYPSAPIAGDNSTTLNFSVLDSDNNNLNNVYSALVISEKQSGKMLYQMPYQRYEFSDISVKYTFPKPGDYVVSLKTRVQDDPKYQGNPLVANFNVSALDPHMIIPFDELMMYYVTPASAVIAGLAVYLHSKKKL